jgi:hypothetical protein
VHPWRGHKDGSRMVLNRDCRKEEHLIHLPVRPKPTNSLF